MNCVNCDGTGELIYCFYCGAKNPSDASCSYCMWTGGENLPSPTQENTDDFGNPNNPADDNICCLCTGSGIQRDIDPGDEHLLRSWRQKQ